LLLLVDASLLSAMGHQLIGDRQHRDGEVVRLVDQSLTVELLFVWLTFLNNFLNPATNIIELKMRSCNWTGVLLVAAALFSIYALVVGEVDVV